MNTNQKNRVLITGGAGFIGSHACVSMIHAGYEPTVFDNLSNSSLEVINRIKKITGKAPNFVKGDIRDSDSLMQTIRDTSPSSVLHFAGLKSVQESIDNPKLYEENNVEGTNVLIKTMESAGIKSIVFSSSATIYGNPATVPISETFPRRTTNPYGRTKLDIELMLEKLSQRSSSWKIASLRYFNPVGAHPSGLIGEDPLGTPNNLMPHITKVAIGRQPRLSVFGGDYSTIDGTGVRDYIHVMDLVDGHISALQFLEKKIGFFALNLGSGRGYSVLEMINAFEKASGQKIPYEFSARRPGDVAECWANINLAQNLLGWSPKRTIDEMCSDSWRWQTQNPNGYRDFFPT